MKTAKQNLIDLKEVHLFMEKPFGIDQFLFPYNSDWSYLMEMVTKIYETPLYYEKFIPMFKNSKIRTIAKENIYNDCLTFIKWYNEQQKN